MTDRFQAYIDDNNRLYVTTLQGNQFKGTIIPFTDNPNDHPSKLVKGIIRTSVQLQANDHRALIHPNGSLHNPTFIQETNNESICRSGSNSYTTYSEEAIEDQEFKLQQEPLYFKHRIERCRHFNNLLRTKIDSDLAFVLGIWKRRNKHSSATSHRTIFKRLFDYTESFYKDKSLSEAYFVAYDLYSPIYPSYNINWSKTIFEESFPLDVWLS